MTRRFTLWPTALAILAVTGGGWLLVMLLEDFGLYLHIGPISSLRLCLLLPPVFWAALAVCGDVLLIRHTAGAFRWVAGLAAAAVELMAVPVLLLWLAIGIDSPRYFTLHAPDETRTVIVEEESRLLSGWGSFYAPVCPGLMRKLDASYGTNDGFRPFSTGAYALTWETDRLLVRYDSNVGDVWETCVVPLT